MDRSTFSELVGAIYDAGVDTMLWPQTLGLICETFGFRKATIDLNRTAGMVNLFNFHYGIDGQQAATMVSHYGGMPEVWGGLAQMMSRPIDRPWVVSRIMTQEALRKTAYFQNWVGPMGLVDGAAIVLARDQHLLGSIRLASDARCGIINDALMEELALLLPHCQRAARISAMLEAYTVNTRNFQDVIDSISTPLLLVSLDCAVVHANPRARAHMEENGVLALRHGQLVSPVPGMQNRISKTIQRLAQDETDIPSTGVGLTIRAADQTKYRLHFLPLASGKMRTRLAKDCVAAIFISSASAETFMVRDIMQSLFELTRAEIGVFEQIVTGNSTEQTAAALGIGASTVRTHLLHIFQKTDTHSRADLVRLAHALAAPVVQ